jgi:hypothetical protein
MFELFVVVPEYFSTVEVRQKNNLRPRYIGLNSRIKYCKTYLLRVPTLFPNKVWESIRLFCKYLICLYVLFGVFIGFRAQSISKDPKVSRSIRIRAQT